MPLNKEKLYVDPDVGEIKFRKSIRSRHISIRVHPVKGVTVSMPYIVPYATGMAFFKLRKEWVLETVRRLRQKTKDIPRPDPVVIEQLRASAKAELPPRLAELAHRYGFTYNRVTIKHNSTNWGSCSTKGNINLNLNIVRLPRILQDYVLIHELCHLRHPDHSHAFHLLLEHLLTDHLIRCVDADPVASELARKAALSKAKYPLDYTMTRAIKKSVTLI